MHSLSYDVSQCRDPGSFKPTGNKAYGVPIHNQRGGEEEEQTDITKPQNLPPPASFQPGTTDAAAAATDTTAIGTEDPLYEQPLQKVDL